MQPRAWALKAAAALAVIISNMLIVGLTGGIASGKSTVTDMLREHLPVLDCDDIAHDHLQKVKA